jgi:hypothetical protein
MRQHQPDREHQRLTGCRDEIHSVSPPFHLGDASRGQDEIKQQDPLKRALLFQSYPEITAGGREMIFGLCNLERMGASLPTSIKTTSCLGAFSSMKRE